MNVMKKSNLTLTQSGLLDVLLKHERRKVILLTRPPNPFLFTHVKHVAAIIAALGFLFWLWFGASTYHALSPRYPYYDTHKPVPTWNEPMPLKGNHERRGDHI